MWQLTEEVSPIDVGHGYYAVRFWNKADYLRVLTGGPWMVMGHYLTVQKWKPGFNAAKAQVGTTMVWIRFPHILMELYGSSVVERMGNLIGKAVRIDPHTKESIRGRYARVHVEIDLHQPLIPYVWVEDRLQVVEYEGLDLICFSCGGYGHRMEGCMVGKPTCPLIHLDRRRPVREFFGDHFFDDTGNKAAPL